MKVTASTLVALFAVASRQASADCLDGGLVFDGLTACSYEALLATYTKQYIEPANNCPYTSAEADLWLKLGSATTLLQAQAYVKSNICPKAYIDRANILFTKAANKGTDYEFEKRYFDGRSDWNEQVETLFGPNGIGVPSYNLQDNSLTVKNFQNGIARTEQVEFPTTLSNFEKCGANVAYCCFVSDRQANDNNGNCATSYDMNCTSKDPGDNTDLCYVDHSRSKNSNKVNSTGEVTYSKDDDNNSDNAEGPTHCHGFAWANDPNDSTSRYKGNNLHFVSMFDHFNQRGYVRNVPGAPMCACAEQMPVISRADCTEIVPKEVFKIFYTGQVWGASLTSIDLTFTACAGYNGNNNNLYAYMQRLYYEKKVNSSQLALLDKSIVGNNNCDYAAAFHMQSKGYRGGYVETTSPTGMTQIAGRGLLLMDGNAVDQSYGSKGESSFMYLYASSTTGILLRVCIDCEASHEKIYLRFNPGYGPKPASPSSEAPFFQWLKSNINSNQTKIGKYDVAWAMYSTYQDALARKNAWKCPNYNWNLFFPGDCDPVQGTKANQYSRFESSVEGRMDTAWFIDAVNPFVPLKQRTFGGTKNFSSIDIGTDYRPVTGGGFDILPNGTMYIRGGGRDIGNDQDMFHFVSHQASGPNATLSVRLRSYVGFPLNQPWSRACLMIRKSSSQKSAGYEFCLTSFNDFFQQWRKVDGAFKESNVYMYDSNSKVNSGTMTVVKKGDYYSAYISYDGINWQQRGPTQYLPGLVNSTYLVGIGINSASDLISEAVFDNYQFINFSSRMACGIITDFN